MPNARVDTPLWKPCTEGEEVFLSLYKTVGADIHVCPTKGSDLDLDCLGSRDSFSEFVRLSATLDVFMRCILMAREFSKASGSSGDLEDLRYELTLMELPASITSDGSFLERLRLAGKIAEDGDRELSEQMKKKVSKDMSTCYICGKQFISNASGANAHAKKTFDHLWSLSFGGDTDYRNLLPSCQKCNGARGSLLSWAAGPVYRTCWMPDETSKHPQHPDLDVTISLGLARLIDWASGRSKSPRSNGQMTLKEAAISMGAIRPDLTYAKKHHLYHDMLRMSRELR